jgi:hypothetical protein
MQVFVTPTGRTIDVASVLCQGSGTLVITSPGMDGPLQERLDKHIFPMDDVQVANIGSQTRCAAMATLQSIEQGCSPYSKLQAATATALCHMRSSSGHSESKHASQWACLHRADAVGCRMFTVLGPAAPEIVGTWGSDVANLQDGSHTTMGFQDAPLVVFKSSGLGPSVPGWTVIVGEGCAAEFFRKVALQVCSG